MNWEDTKQLEKALIEGAKVKEWIFTQRETIQKTYVVQAKTRAAARVILEEEYVEAVDGSHEWISDTAFKADGVTIYTPCPNIGRAWSDIPVNDVTFREDDDQPLVEGKVMGWHYNGACEIIAKDGGMCGHCASKIRQGMRFTLPRENVYLNKSYSLGLIE